MARIAVRPRDDLARYLLAFAVVALLAVTGAGLGRLASGEGGASGSSSSGGGNTTSSGSSNSSNGRGSDGSSNSSSNDQRDGTSNSSSNDQRDGDGSSSSGSNDDTGDDTGGGTGGGAPSGGASPATTAPAGPTTTLAPTASTIPRDLPKGTPPSHEIACPRDTEASGQGGRVRCYAVDDVDNGDRVTVIGIPGIPTPVPLPAPVVVPVDGDTGDSGSTHNDNSVTITYDIDNRTVVEAAPHEAARAGQRVAATLALLLLLPIATAVVLHLLRDRRRPAPPSYPPPTYPPPSAPPAPPPPRGRWVWQEEPAEEEGE